MALIGVAAQGNDIQRRIQDGTRDSLAGLGESAATFVVDGRDVTLSGVPQERIADTVRAVGAVHGIGAVAAQEPALSPLRIDVDDKQVVVSGATQQESWRQRFVLSIGNYAHGRTVVDHTTTSPGVDFAMTTTGAVALVSVLTAQQGTRLSVSVVDGRVVVDGVLPDDNSKATTTKMLRQLFGTGVVVDKTSVQGSPR